MKQYYFNNEEITKETILKTRKFFHDNTLACIEDVESGRDTIPEENKEKYFKLKRESAEQYINGENDHILAFLQHAYYIQTRKSIALLP